MFRALDKVEIRLFPVRICLSERDSSLDTELWITRLIYEYSPENAKMIRLYIRRVLRIMS